MVLIRRKMRGLGTIGVEQKKKNGTWYGKGVHHIYF